MSLIASELDGLLHPRVKRKANKTGNLRAAKRVTSSATEVMVKITGFGKGAGHVKAHLDYITRNGKLEMENDRGEVFSGKDEVKTLFDDWEKDFSDGERRKNQRDTMHMVLSMPEGTDVESVHMAVREFTKETFGGKHEYVFALHTDEPHPHCHVTVKCLGFDGTRLNPRKADLQQWRVGFAEKLRDQGVDAEASPRNSRGVVKKAEASVIRHIERGDKTHKPRVSKVKAAKIKEVAQELTDEAKGLTIPVKPWEEAIKSQQQKIRQKWLAVAGALETDDSRITFNNKVAHNDRPQYERISDNEAKRGQRAAALYQSNLEVYGRQESPRSIASLRNVSGVSVVHNRQGNKVLLRQDALNSVGKDGRADPKMRRSGVGASRDSGSAERLSSSSKALADNIRGFVASMPLIDSKSPLLTEREELKRMLKQKFTKQPEKVQATKVDAAVPAKSNDKAAVQEPSKPVVNKDIER